MRHADLLREIAGLTLTHDNVEARVRAQAATIADLERARIGDSHVIDGLRAEIAVLGEKLASQATPIVSVEPVPAMVDEVVSVDGSATEMLRTAACGIDDRVDHARNSEPTEVEPTVSANIDAASPISPRPALGSPGPNTRASVSWPRLVALDRRSRGLELKVRWEVLDAAGVRDDAPALAFASLPAADGRSRAYGVSCEWRGASWQRSSPCRP